MNTAQYGEYGKTIQSCLFHTVDLNNIVMLHPQGSWGVVVVYPLRHKEESESGDGQPTSFAVRLLQIQHRGILIECEV